VSFAGLRQRIEDLVRETDPAVVVSLGLWPGEPVIRLERVAVNIADFEIPDNDGMLVVDGLVAAAAPAARVSTLPLRAVERALLQAGVPARLSTTAGTFLCNAALYSALEACESSGARCGFVHLPYLPEQVASLLAELRKGQSLELHQRADLPSMSLATMVGAVRIVMAVSVTTNAEGVA
jgi:pyroglutamyl-peptidase